MIWIAFENFEYAIQWRNAALLCSLLCGNVRRISEIIDKLRVIIRYFHIISMESWPTMWADSIYVSLSIHGKWFSDSA